MSPLLIGSPGGGGGMARQSSEEYRLKCHVCCEDIVGPRFVCIHCPGELDFCVKCADVSDCDEDDDDDGQTKNINKEKQTNKKQL